MARVFVTGSSDGLGLMAGQLLAEEGHKVVLHARNDARAADAKKAAPKAEAVVVGSRPRRTWQGRSTRSALSTRSFTTPASASVKVIA
jgi:NAD(P)-dependent dehydrogenase (short-subunit alcohol dehydrogenase family)